MKKCIPLMLAILLIVLLSACQSTPAESDAPASTGSVHQHSYCDTVLAPTCTAVGYTTYTCECGDTMFRNLINPTGHRYSDTVVAPTGEAAGYTEHTCDACGDTYKDSFVAPLDLSHRHTYQATDTIAPGCDRIGYTVYTCTCGDSYMDELRKAFGHRYSDKVVAPTAEAQGYTEHTCSNCGNTYMDSFVAPLTAPHVHQYMAVQTVEATCIAEGYTLYRCSCADEFQGNYTDLADHSYTATIFVPTHTTQGYTEHTCSVCEDTYQDTYVDPTPEHYYVVEEVVPPSCTADGFTVYRCHCGSTLTQDRVAPTGHHHTAQEVVEPTYTDRGYTVYVCEDCGNTYHDDFTDKLPQEPTTGHVCSGGAHIEVQMGGYTYVYCDTIEAPYLADDGTTIYYPYEYYF